MIDADLLQALDEVAADCGSIRHNIDLALVAAIAMMIVMLRRLVYLFVSVLAFLMTGCDEPASIASQEVERCLIANLDGAHIAEVEPGTCVSDNVTMRYPMNPEVAGELKGTAINSDTGMNLVTCLVSQSRRTYTVSPFTMAECEIRNQDGQANYAIIVPDYVEIHFVAEALVSDYDATMIVCRTWLGEITTSRASCEQEGGVEVGAKQVVGDPYAWVTCKVSLAEVETTAALCVRQGGVVIEEVDP
ncbi:MAG: hypothetical protein AAF563_03775 [Pseudomonadota bacterium]